MDIVNLVIKVATAELDKAQKSLQGIQNELQKTQQAAESSGNSIGSSITPSIGALNISMSSLAIGATVVAGAIGAVYSKLADMRDQSIDAADAMNDLSNRSNIATARLSLLDAMAKMAGSSAEALVSSSERLGAKLAKQDEETGRAVSALKELGLSTKDSNGETKSMIKLQEEIVLAVDKAQNSAAAQGAAVQLLGNEYYKLKTPIKEAAENQSDMYDYMLKTNALISTSLAKNSDDYKDKVSKLGLAFTGIGNSIAEVTLPLMIKFQEKMIAIAEYAADVIRKFAGLTTASEETGEALGKLMIDRKNQLAAIEKMEKSALNTEGGDSSALKAARARVTAINDQIREMTKLKAAADSTAESMKKAATAGTKEEGNKPAGKPSKPVVPVEIRPNAIVDAINRETQSISKLQEEYRALFGIEQKLNQVRVENDIAAGKYKQTKTSAAATPEELQTLRDQARLADELAAANKRTGEQLKIGAQIAKEYEQAMDKIRSAQEAANSAVEDARLSSLREIDENRIRIQVLSKFGSTQDDVNIALAEYRVQQAGISLAAAISRGDSAERIISLQKELDLLRLRNSVVQGTATDNKNADPKAGKPKTLDDGIADGLEKIKTQSMTTGEMMSSAFTGAADKMGDAFAEFALTGKLNMKSFAASFIADITRMIAKQMILRALTSAFGGGGGGLIPGGVGAVPYAKGGAFSGGIQFFANGGVVDSPTGFGMSGGKMGVMGEAGPEAIMPLKRGSDGKLGVSMSGAGGGTVINSPIYITVQGGNTSEETAAETAKAVRQAAREVFMEETTKNRTRQAYAV